jgi:hypothetical protein
MTRYFLASALFAVLTVLFSCASPDPSAQTAEKIKGKWLVVGLKKNGKDIGTDRLDTTYVQIDDHKLTSDFFPLINRMKYSSELSYKLEEQRLQTEPELDIAVQSVDEHSMVLLLSGLAPPNGGPSYDFELLLDRAQ